MGVLQNAIASFFALKEALVTREMELKKSKESEPQIKATVMFRPLHIGLFGNNGCFPFRKETTNKMFRIGWQKKWHKG